MVAHENDDRVVGETQPIEGVEQPADLGVEEADRGVVGADDLALRLRVDAPVGRRREPRGSGGLRGGLGKLRRRRNPLERIHVEVLLGRDERTVRPVEPCADEERPILVLLEERDGLGRDLAVGVRLVGRGGGIEGERAAQAPRRRVVRELRLLVLVDPARIDHEVPRLRIVEAAGADVARVAVVVDLADARHGVAAPLEHLRQRHHIRGSLRKSVWRSSTPFVSGRSPVSSETRLGLHKGNCV